jgi:hypothetical protein
MTAPRIDRAVEGFVDPQPQDKVERGILELGQVADGRRLEKDAGTTELSCVPVAWTQPTLSPTRDHAARFDLRDYGSHEHPMLRHRSQRRRLGLDRPVPAGSPTGWAVTHDQPARRP